MIRYDPLPDDKALRKAWLKKKFSSFDYHEELLTLHDRYLTIMHRHWAKSEIQKQYTDIHRTMISPVFVNFDKIPKPRGMTWTGGEKNTTVGWADTITYNFNRGLGDFGPPFTEYAGMSDSDIRYLNELVGTILRYCQNIKYTIDERWIYEGSDDYILDESYTGPIDWPADWPQNILGEQSIATAFSSNIRVRAGEPVPQSGMWQALDVKGTRQTAQAGDKLPDLQSAYGTTVWQLVQP